MIVFFLISDLTSLMFASCYSLRMRMNNLGSLMPVDRPYIVIPIYLPIVHRLMLKVVLATGSAIAKHASCFLPS